jgi:glutathione synthase
MASASKGERRGLCAGMMWESSIKLYAEIFQNLSLGLFRSDYMVHQSTNDPSPTIKQVEFNTIASSFGGLSSQTSRLHKSVIDKSQDFLPYR